MTSHFYLSKSAPSAALAAARGPSGRGYPLPANIRASLEPRFHHDFSRVRVHSDGEAVASSRALGVPAYSVGRDIVLGAGALGTESAESHRLIAHELAHVVQSDRGAPTSSVAAAEAEAEQAGELAAAGHEAPVERSAPAAQTLCAPKDLLPGVGYRPPELLQTWYTLDDFDTKKADLKPKHLATVAKVAKDLAQDPLLGGFITVIGYADAIGSGPENKALGQQRADAVRGALIEAGVSADDMRAYSLGEEVLAVETPKAEAKNRRVEIVVRRRRMRFGLAPTATSKPIGSFGPVTQEGREAGTSFETEKGEEAKSGDRRQEFERRIRDLAVDKGAKKESLFDEAVKYLADNGGPDLANEVAKIAESVGIDRKWAKEKVQEGIEKGIEAGLKEALKAILTAIAGPPSPRPSFETGPPVFEQGKPPIFTVPVPFPGDKPKPANITNPTLQVTDRLSPTQTKTLYKRGEFISFNFTTPVSFGQLRAVVEIVPADGGAALRSIGVMGRRSGSESLEVPDAVGSFILQVRLVGETPHPRGTFRFSVQ